MKKLLLTLCMMLVCVFALASCGGSGSEDDPNASVTPTCHLTRGHSGTKLESDGIEDVTLGRCVDGDTTSFTGKNSGLTFTVRYLCIDTPESTQGYDKWGKAASVFNASKLENAKSIVVECETSKATQDGNKRYLCYVWYMPKDGSQYLLLNLELVEEGYTLSGASKSTKYYDYFQKANNKAKAAKLRIFGNEEDIYYSEEINNVTLKELKENASKYYDKSTQIPKCVAFDAYVVDVSLSSSSFKTATVEQVIDGRKYTYTITVGYDSGASLFSLAHEGMYIHFVGWPDGSGAIHGCKTAVGQTSGLWSYALNGSRFYKLPNCNATYYDGQLILRGTYTPVMGSPMDIVAVYAGSDASQALADAYNGKTVVVYGYYTDETKPNELSVYCKAAINVM